MHPVAIIIIIFLRLTMNHIINKISAFLWEKKDFVRDYHVNQQTALFGINRVCFVV